MKTHFGLALAGLIVAAIAGGPVQAQKMVYLDGRAELASDVIPDEFICVFRPNEVARDQVRPEAARMAGAEGGAVRHHYTSSIRGFSIHITAEGLARMQARNPRIAYCEPDRVITLGKPGHASTAGQAVGDRPGEWRLDLYRDQRGLDHRHRYRRHAHPDLLVDTAKSKNFVSKGIDSGPGDQNGHGTHVSGTTAAINNSIGVVGVAAGAKVVAVRVLDRNGSGSWSDVIAGIDYVACKAANNDVANMSLAGPFSQAVNDAVIAASRGNPGSGCVGAGTKKNVFFALAAGNETADASTKSPASAEGPNIFTIAAFSQGGVWASFSNYGAPVDFAEPGVSIQST